MFSAPKTLTGLRFSATIIYPAVCLIAAALLLCACSPEPVVIPSPNFEVISLSIEPSPAMAGQQVTVTASIANTGGMIGNFKEPLLINDEPIATNVTTIPENDTKTISYTISRDRPGQYTLKLGDASTTLVVKAMVEKEVELKYDSDTSRDALWAGTNSGFLIDFIPPVEPFKLTKVRICGGIYGTDWEGKTFQLFILDSNKNPIYSEEFPVHTFEVRGAFPYRPPTWTDFTIPPLDISGQFYVYLFTSMNRHRGIHVGVDDSIPNEHSAIAQGKSPPYISIIPMKSVYPAGQWYCDDTRVNWMIRAVGTTLVPAD